MRSSPGCPPVGTCPLFDPRPVARQAVESARADVGAELARLPDDRFSGAKHQPPILRHRTRDSLEREGLLLGAEVEEHVPAENDVEVAGMRRRLEQVMDLEANRLAKRLDR